MTVTEGHIEVVVEIMSINEAPEALCAAADAYLLSFDFPLETRREVFKLASRSLDGRAQRLTEAFSPGFAYLR